MAFELKNEGLKVTSQEPITFKWDGFVFEKGFRADLIIEIKVIIGVKSFQILSLVHPKQLLTYLKLTDLKLGPLLSLMRHCSKTESKEL